MYKFVLVLLMISLICEIECAKQRRIDRRDGEKRDRNDDDDDKEVDDLVNNIKGFSGDVEPQTIKGRGDRKKSDKNSKGNSLSEATKISKNGQTVVRLQQYYDDVLVLGAQITDVTVDDDQTIDIIDRRTRKPTGKKRTIKKSIQRHGKYVFGLDGDIGQIDKTKLRTNEATEKLKQKRSNERRNNGNKNNRQRSNTRGDRDGNRRRSRQVGNETSTNDTLSAFEAKKWAENAEPIILVKDDKGTINYISKYMSTDDEGNLVYPHAILDSNLNVIYEWDGIQAATALVTGPGGNTKTGKYTWGTAGKDKLSVTKTGSTCKMENTYVRTIDNKNTTDDSIIAAYQWNCANGQSADKPINGAFGPINDAHGHATYTLSLFNDWYTLYPLITRPLKMRPHWMSGLENAAFIPGTGAVFVGDGASEMFPLSTLDIIAHEIGHGVTEFSSNLLYFGEPGAINEAFSDMMGKFIQTMASGNLLPTDWLIGATALKGKGAYLRNMLDPTADAYSRSHVTQIECDDEDIHRTSGIFNKAFALFATKSEYGIMDAFEVFLSANLLRWSANSGFASAAKDAMDTLEDMKANAPPPFLAMYDYSSLNPTHLSDAFKDVGIMCTKNTTWTCQKAAQPQLAQPGGGVIPNFTPTCNP